MRWGTRASGVAQGTVGPNDAWHGLVEEHMEPAPDTVRKEHSERVRHRPLSMIFDERISQTSGSEERLDPLETGGHAFLDDRGRVPEQIRIFERWNRRSGVELDENMCRLRSSGRPVRRRATE